MKHFFVKLGLLFTFLTIVSMSVFAQGGLPDLPTADDGVGAYIPWVEAIYGAIVLIVGWLSHLIPGVNKIPSKAWRIAAIAIVGAGIFVIAGFSSGIPLFISYLIATKVYELFIKSSLPTPDTEEDKKRKIRRIDEARAQAA